MDMSGIILIDLSGNVLIQTMQPLLEMQSPGGQLVSIKHQWKVPQAKELKGNQHSQSVTG